MSRKLALFLAGFLAAFGIADAGAQGAAANTANAVALVESAIAYLKKNGREKAFAEFDNRKGPFNGLGLYVVVYDMQGKVLSHGANPRMIGKDLIELRDADRLGSVAYQTGPKSICFHRHENMVVGCAIEKM